MKKLFLSVFISVFVFFSPLFAEEFSGVFNISLGENFNSVEAKLTESGWEKEQMFKNVNEYKNPDAKLYDFPLYCLDLKFNHDKLAMIIMYFNMDSESEGDSFSAVLDKFVSTYGFTVYSESGNFDERTYKSTLLNNRKMMVVSNPEVTGANIQVSVADIDLLLN